jgi:hypothetical protein
LLSVTPREELIDDAAQRVGIQVTSNGAASRLNAIIDVEVVRPTRT